MELAKYCRLTILHEWYRRVCRAPSRGSGATALMRTAWSTATLVLRSPRCATSGVVRSSKATRAAIAPTTAPASAAARPSGVRCLDASYAKLGGGASTRHAAPRATRPANGLCVLRAAMTNRSTSLLRESTGATCLHRWLSHKISIYCSLFRFSFFHFLFLFYSLFFFKK